MAGQIGACLRKRSEFSFRAINLHSMLGREIFLGCLANWLLVSCLVTFSRNLVISFDENTNYSPLSLFWPKLGLIFDGNAWPDNIPFLIGRRLTWLRCWLRNNYVRSSCGSECNQVGLLFRRRRIERIAVKMHG